MSILGSIITTIFNHGKAPATPASTSTPAAPSESPAPAPTAPARRGARNSGCCADQRRARTGGAERSG